MTKNGITKLLEEIATIGADIASELETLRDASDFHADAECDEDREQALFDTSAAIDTILEEVEKLKEKKAALGV